MPYSAILDEEISPETFLPYANRPRPESYDSAEEFSLEHWRQVRKLVEAEDPELNGYLFDDSCVNAA